jgi:predicted metal-binding membrane protein
MGRAARGPDPWVLALGSISLLAWSILAIGASDLALPAYCSGAIWAVPLPALIDLALTFTSPARMGLDWGLMVAAMMWPLTVAPLRHVRGRSFARRRPRAMLLFLAGYTTAWMIAGMALQAIALLARWAAPAPLACFALAAALATVWQMSPAKQWHLNRCHRRPPLAAFGAAADRDALAFGLTNGMACAGACWALMLLPLVLGPMHLFAMAAVALFVFAERLESPAPLAWRWRGVGTALRIVTAQARMRLRSAHGLPRGLHPRGDVLGVPAGEA